MNHFTPFIIIIILSNYNVIAQNALLKAIYTNDLTTAHRLIFNPNTNINEKVNNDRYSRGTVTTPLKLAIECDRLDIIKYLLDRKDLAINAQMGAILGDKRNFTPLQLAFSRRNEDIIKALLTNVNIDLNVEINGFPLLAAVIFHMKGNTDIIKAIMAHKNFDPAMLKKKDSKGNTPIDWAKILENNEAVKLFEDKAKDASSMHKHNTFKTSINQPKKDSLLLSNKLSSINKDYTTKTSNSNPNTLYRYLSSSSNKLSSTKNDYTSKTHGQQSKFELDSQYYKKTHEFLNKPETKQKELKTELVVKELHDNKIPPHIKWHSLDIDEKCVFLWTLGYYDTINTALRNDKDNNYWLNYWMPCIVGIVNYLKKTKSKEIISYRGTSIPIEQDKLYKLDSNNKELVTVVNFLSTSKVERRALDFPLQGASEGEVKVLFVITVPENAVAADIEHLSNFPNEFEVLLKPFTVFRVIKYSTQGKKRPYIYVEIVDCTKNDCSKAYVRHM